MQEIYWVKHPQGEWEGKPEKARRPSGCDVGFTPVKGKREGGLWSEASGYSRVLRKPWKADQEFPNKGYLFRSTELCRMAQPWSYCHAQSLSRGSSE